MLSDEAEIGLHGFGLEQLQELRQAKRRAQQIQQAPDGDKERMRGGQRDIGDLIRQLPWPDGGSRPKNGGQVRRISGHARCQDQHIGRFQRRIAGEGRPERIAQHLELAHGSDRTVNTQGEIRAVSVYMQRLDIVGTDAVLDRMQSTIGLELPILILILISSKRMQFEILKLHKEVLSEPAPRPQQRMHVGLQIVLEQFHLLVVIGLQGIAPIVI